MALLAGKLFRAATRSWYGPFARPDRIVNVAVRDQDFELVRILDCERDLAAFRKQWAALVEVDRDCHTWQRGQPYYKLAIQSVGLGGRAESSWYYFPGGYFKLLAVMRAIWVAPLYRAATPDAFEALLIGR